MMDSRVILSSCFKVGATEFDIVLTLPCIRLLLGANTGWLEPSDTFLSAVFIRTGGAVADKDCCFVFDLEVLVRVVDLALWEDRDEDKDGSPSSEVGESGAGGLNKSAKVSSREAMELLSHCTSAAALTGTTIVMPFLPIPAPALSVDTESEDLFEDLDLGTGSHEGRGSETGAGADARAPRAGAIVGFKDSFDFAVVFAGSVFNLAELPAAMSAFTSYVSLSESKVTSSGASSNMIFSSRRPENSTFKTHQINETKRSKHLDLPKR